MNSLQKIKRHYNSYSKKEKVIADYFLNHTGDVVDSNIYKMAETLQVSPSMISKFVAKYCDDTFQNVKLDIAKNTDQSAYDYCQHIFDWTNSISELPVNVIGEMSKVCMEVMEVNRISEFEKIIHWIYEAQNIYFFCVGSSAIVAGDFQQKLLRLGKKCIYMQDSHMNILNAMTAGPQDLCVAISFDGRTREVNMALKEARKRHVKCVAITRYATTAAAELADSVLFVPSVEVEHTRIAPIFSRYGQMFVMDILFLGLTRLYHDSLDAFIEQNENIFEKLKED